MKATLVFIFGPNLKTRTLAYLWPKLNQIAMVTKLIYANKQPSTTSRGREDVFSVLNRIDKIVLCHGMVSGITYLSNITLH